MPEVATLAPEALEQIVSAVAARMAVLLTPAQPPLPRLLSSAEVMALLGYSETEPFLAAARAAKCPMVRINSRKILFDPADVAAWLQRLKETGPQTRTRIEIGSPLQQRRWRDGR